VHTLAGKGRPFGAVILTALAVIYGLFRLINAFPTPVVLVRQTLPTMRLIYTYDEEDIAMACMYFVVAYGCWMGRSWTYTFSLVLATLNAALGIHDLLLLLHWMARDIIVTAFFIGPVVDIAVNASMICLLMIPAVRKYLCRVPLQTLEN